jgi:hypothetical protein
LQLNGKSVVLCFFYQKSGKMNRQTVDFQAKKMGLLPALAGEGRIKLN